MPESEHEDVQKPATPDPVTVLGLGPMGTALARTLLRHGRRVIVHNRTPSKAGALVRDGAVHAPSVAAALHGSATTVLCVADYHAANALLDAPGAREALRGRTLIHLSTGTPRQAREFHAQVSAAGAGYLDGAILVTPSQIGTPESALLVAGAREVFDAARPSLRPIATQLDYVGADPGAAAALDLAFLSHFFGGLLGFYHGARIMEAENLPVTQLGEMIQAVAPALGSIVNTDAQRIARNAYDAPESTLANSATVVELIRAHAAEAALDSRFADFATNLFRAGIAAGHARRDVAALMEVLRGKVGVSARNAVALRSE